MKVLSNPSQEDLDKGCKPIQILNTKPHEFKNKFKNDCDIIKKKHMG